MCETMSAEAFRQQGKAWHGFSGAAAPGPSKQQDEQQQRQQQPPSPTVSP